MLLQLGLYLSTGFLRRLGTAGVERGQVQAVDGQSLHVVEQGGGQVRAVPHPHLACDQEARSVGLGLVESSAGEDRKKKKNT